MDINLADLSVKQLRRALELKEQIEALKQKLAELGDTSGVPAKASAGGARKPGGKRVMSASAKARIGAAQRARWAKAKGEKPETAQAKPGKKRKMSPAARARIAEAARERWAKARAAGRSKL